MFLLVLRRIGGLSMDFFLVHDDCLVLRRIGGLSTKKVITFSEALRVTPYRRFIDPRFHRN